VCARSGNSDAHVSDLRREITTGAFARRRHERRHSVLARQGKMSEGAKYLPTFDVPLPNRWRCLSFELTTERTLKISGTWAASLSSRDKRSGPKSGCGAIDRTPSPVIARPRQHRRLQRSRLRRKICTGTNSAYAPLSRFPRLRIHRSCAVQSSPCTQPRMPRCCANERPVLLRRRAVRERARNLTHHLRTVIDVHQRRS
jgi:hypothetical protein